MPVRGLGPRELAIIHPGCPFPMPARRTRNEPAVVRPISSHSVLSGPARSWPAASGPVWPVRSQLVPSHSVPSRVERRERNIVRSLVNYTPSKVECLYSFDCSPGCERTSIGSWSTRRYCGAFSIPLMRSDALRRVQAAHTLRAFQARNFARGPSRRRDRSRNRASSFQQLKRSSIARL